MNVALLPVFWGLYFLSQSSGWAQTMPDLYKLVVAVLWIDIVLLVFNILPIYPLDGGQILRSLLWFVIGRGRSLMVATIVGFIGVAGVVVLAFWMRSIWFVAIAVFMLMNCWSGLRHAQALLRFAKLPRRFGLACPACNTSPPVGDFWKCGRCGQQFDIFQTQGTCPRCATQFAATKCLDCGAVHPISEWAVPVTNLTHTLPASTI